jgi:hypothetical protein
VPGRLFDGYQCIGAWHVYWLIWHISKSMIMKKIVPFLIILLVSITTSAQVISRFTWESNPTTAISGSNAVSVSSYATVSTGGCNGTKGLNPGAGSNDINLVLDGSSFNVPAIDISIDFRREESQATFFYRGSFFDFGMNAGSLGVKFEIVSGSTYTTINSGNVYSIPDDHSFHTYRFSYDNNAGVANIWVDGTKVYTYNGAAGAPLYWTGAGNVTIGKDMDATGRNVAVLDNLIVLNSAAAALPLKLLSFKAETKNKYAVINWNTTKEISVTGFILERSVNGAAFTAIKTIGASGEYNMTNYYQVTDSVPLSPVGYYRIKMLDVDGNYTYSDVKAVSFDAPVKTEISFFPNPTVDYVTVRMNNAAAGQLRYTVVSLAGQTIDAGIMQLNSGVQQIQIDLTKTTIKGLIIIQLHNIQTNTTETIKVIKS